MSRLTGNDAKGLMEAYQAVYAPQELTEEQIWEEVENWVHSLLEEGYDLSEYTWDEMYEDYVTEAIPLAIPPAMAAAPYVLPALGAAAYGLKGLMNRNRTKNTPDEERFLSTGSFAASKDAERRGKEAAELNRKQNQPTQPTSTPVSGPTSTPVSGRNIRGERPRIRVAATRPQGSTTSTPRASVQQPKPPEKPEKPPESPKTPAKPPETTPGQSSTSSTGSGSGAAGKPPGYGEKLRQRMKSDEIRRTAEKEARRARPNPIGQAVQDTAVDLTARGLNTLATGLKRTAVGAGIAGLAGAADQGFGGGVVGKSARDFTNWTRQAGPAYDKFMGRGKGTTPPPPKPQRGTPPKVESFYASGGIIEEKVNPIEIYNRQGNLQKVTPGKGYPITKGGKRGYVVYNTSGKPKFTEYPTQPTPAAQPPANPGAKQPGESLRDYAIRTEREASQAQPPAQQPPAQQPPAQQPPAQQPPAQQPQRLPVQSAPTKTPPAPKPQAQTGDRTKDLTTWALANKIMIDKVGTKAQREILTKAQTGGTMPAPRPLKTSLKDSYDYDAYDLVVEYLLSQGHVDTLEEAHYVMMEMDAETIGTIVEAAADQSDKQIDKGVKTTYKAQNVLDNQHQGRSKGLNRLPRGEREEKAKRMGGRLKSRRDDLFGERNKREDSKREQLKKMLGL